MSRKYLELCSQYRDRNQYPHPGEFEVQISQTGSKDRKQALDPVCESTPVLSFNNSFRNDTTASYVDITLVFPSTSNTIENVDALITIIIESSLGYLRQEKNFYRGAVVEFSQVIGSSTVSIRRRISSYEFISYNSSIPTSDQAYVTFDIPIPDGVGVTVSAVGVITNPTDTTLSVKPQIFLPSAILIDGHYQNYYIQNITLNETRTISYFNATTCMATINETANWVIGQYYVIRKVLPLTFGQIISSTINSLTINSVSSPNSSYVGSFVRISKPLPTYPLSTLSQCGELRRIIGYNGLTITVAPIFSAIPTSGAGTEFEILDFSYDNAYPFVYTGSTISQQEMSCYEIELNDLILPNNTLAVGSGGLIAFYPYVYVELQNVSASGAGLSNTIYSNNPNSTKMMFRCAIDDIQNPLTSTFVKIDSDGMSVTLKFKINDNLKFSVKLPNGDVFRTIEEDYVSPSPPNPLIQISAMFTLRKI